MSFGGSSPSMPPETPIPTTESQEVKDAAAAARRAARLRQGRASTILSGNNPDMLGTPALNKPTLLGGV